MTDGIELATIRIVSSTNDGDTESVEIEATEGTSAVVLLGMIELAKVQVVERLTGSDT